MSQAESLQAGLFRAWFDSLRQIGGEPLLHILLAQAGELGLRAANGKRLKIVSRDFKYDVAFSFGKDDEGLAIRLINPALP